MATLAELEAVYAAMKDPQDVQGTEREVNEHAEQRAWLSRMIYAIKREQDTGEMDREISLWERFDGYAPGWRAVTEGKLEAGPPSGLNPRQVDRWRFDLTTTITVLDRGFDPNVPLPEDFYLARLMAEKGLSWPRDFLGSIPVVQQRLAMLRKNRDDQRTRLAALLDSVTVVSE